MPVECLTDEQATAFGSFADKPTRPELERFFFLDDEDRKLIAKRRGDHSRLGSALQMCTVRYIGLFLEDPCPWRGRWWSTWPRSWRSRMPPGSSGTPSAR
nr:DUF4158 domain-containing protein [Streptomyces capillispiralis]